MRLDGTVVARVHAALEAPVIDLSTGGALVDIQEALRPGTRFTVLLPLDDEQTLRLKARVVRSRLVSLAQESGQPAHYRAAIEFIDVTDDAAASLTALLDRLHRADPPPCST